MFSYFKLGKKYSLIQISKTTNTDNNEILRSLFKSFLSLLIKTIKIHKRFNIINAQCHFILFQKSEIKGDIEKNVQDIIKSKIIINIFG